MVPIRTFGSVHQFNSQMRNRTVSEERTVDLGQDVASAALLAKCIVATTVVLQLPLVGVRLCDSDRPLGIQALRDNYCTDGPSDTVEATEPLPHQMPWQMLGPLPECIRN